MATTVWGIKLGSNGRRIPFCQRHNIVGVGWKHVDLTTIKNGTRNEISQHLHEIYPKEGAKKLAQWTGSLLRFTQECEINDFILFYDPHEKRAYITMVTSECRHRNFAPEAQDTIGKEVDIWLYRKVKVVGSPNFGPRLANRLKRPQIAFW